MKKEGGTKEKTPEQALKTLMWVCARAEKSSGDALRLMRSWGVPPAEQSRVLDTLIAQKFIDDARYSAAYVREKSRLNGWGERKILAGLRLKGVSRDVAIWAMEEQMEGLEEGTSERVGRMMEKKIRGFRAKAKDEWDLRGRMLRYGMSLGYDYDDVTRAIEQIMNGE